MKNYLHLKMNKKNNNSKWNIFFLFIYLTSIGYEYVRVDSNKLININLKKKRKKNTQRT